MHFDKKTSKASIMILLLMFAAPYSLAESFYNNARLYENSNEWIYSPVYSTFMSKDETNNNPLLAMANSTYVVIKYEIYNKGWLTSLLYALLGCCLSLMSYLPLTIFGIVVPIWSISHMSITEFIPFYIISILKGTLGLGIDTFLIQIRLISGVFGFFW